MWRRAREKESEGEGEKCEDGREGGCGSHRDEQLQ